MKTRIVTALALGLMLCGCVRTVTTQPYRLNESNSGVVYALPKTRLQVTIPYTIRYTTTLQNGVPAGTAQDVLISKPVALQPLLLPDPDNTFVLSGENLVKDASLDASFKFQVNDNQLLAAITSDAQDKSPQIFQGLVASGIAVAKMVAVAGPAGKAPPVLAALGERINQITEEIAAAEKLDDPGKAVARLDLLLKEQARLQEEVKRFQENNMAKVEEKEMAYTRALDLTDFRREGEWLVADICAPPAMLGDFATAEVPAVRIELQITEDQQRNAKARRFPNSSRPPEPGVVYRVPTPVRVRVTVAPKAVVVLDGEISFAQLGPFNQVEAKYKTWAKRTTQITFSPKTGSLSEYGVDATSSAEAATSALGTSLGKTQAAVEEIRKTQAAADAKKTSPNQLRLNDLEMQRDLLKAEADVIKARQELDQARAAIGSN